jgi:DUF1680 family protein
MNAQNFQEQNLRYEEVRPRELWASRVQLALTKLWRDKDSCCHYIGWGADQLGRWIGATSVLHSILGIPIDSEIQAKVQELLANQDHEGLFFGDQLRAEPSSPHRVWFGQGRAIWNLLDYYRITGDARVLSALFLAADCAVADQAKLVVRKPLGCGIESVLGAMAVLGWQTGKQKYIDYAKYLAEHVDSEVALPSESVPSDTAVIEHSHHSHSYLNIMQGLVDLFVVTGEERYLAQAKRVFEATLPSIWVDGGISEGYGQPYEHDNEICSVVDWIMLALKIFAVTGEIRYLDAAELSILNQLLFGQNYEGGFTTHRSLDRRHWRDEKNWGSIGIPEDFGWTKDWGISADFCCTMHGSWILAQAATYTLTRNQNGLSVNLPLDIDAHLKHRGNEIKVSQRTRITATEMVQELKISNPKGTPLNLKMRVPYWCDIPALWIDGQPQRLLIDNRFIPLKCEGKSEYSIELRMPLKLRIIPARRNALNANSTGAPGEASEQGLQYGPFVLMFNREMHKEVRERDIALTVPVDDRGCPLVSQDLPKDWQDRGAIPLFLDAQLRNGTPISLTPCANMTLTPFSVVDPYVLRFSGIRILSH